MYAARNVDGMRNVSIDGRVVAMVASTSPLASGKGLRTLYLPPVPSLILFLFLSEFSSRSNRETCNAKNLESRYRIEHGCRLRGVSMIVSTPGRTDGGKVGENETRDGSRLLLSRLPPSAISEYGHSRGRHYRECFATLKIRYIP